MRSLFTRSVSFVVSGTLCGPGISGSEFNCCRFWRVLIEGSEGSEGGEGSIKRGTLGTWTSSIFSLTSAAIDSGNNSCFSISSVNFWFNFRVGLGGDASTGVGMTLSLRAPSGVLIRRSRVSGSTSTFSTGVVASREACLANRSLWRVDAIGLFLSFENVGLIAPGVVWTAGIEGSRSSGTSAAATLWNAHNSTVEIKNNRIIRGRNMIHCLTPIMLIYV